jgi:hypothetical protein
MPRPDSTTQDVTPDAERLSGGELEAFCADGRPCIEVTARLLAADRSHLDGFADAALRLREVASWFADEHAYGTSSDDDQVRR